MRPSITIALAAGLAAPQAVGAAEIRTVTLSTAGLALIEAEEQLGDVPATLSVRRGDIDDFLKSFWLQDPAGGVPSISLPGDGAFADTFDLLPLDPDDLTDPAGLLGAMIGAEIEVERQGETTTGRNMGVVQRPCEDGSCSFLTLSDDSGGLRQFRFDAGLDIRFADPADRAMIARALDAWRGQSDPGTIPVEIGSDVPEPRDVTMTWLQEAPAWQTAYRAIDGAGGLRLQGWAVLENATGHDWQDVTLTLATGDVRALEVELYARQEVAREQAEEARAPGAADVVVGRTMQSGLAPSPEPAPAAPVEADDGASFSRYTLTDPVSLAAGEMVSLPFLDETLAEARMLLFRGGRGQQHPDIALEIENPLPLRLPAGVLTLYEAGRGHAGDAMIPEIPPEGEATVNFATERAVTVREDQSRVDSVREMRVSGGVLRITEDLERRTLYRIEGAADAARTVTIDHPRRRDWTLTAPEPAEERLDWWRYEVEVPSGEIARLEVVERQPRERGFGLLEMDIDTLQRWGSTAPDAETRALLEELAGLRREQANLAEQIGRLQQRERELVEEQQRLVELITALGDESDANARRRDRVDAIDGEIAAAREERRDLQQRRDAIEREIRELIGA
ncbi:hypothetical protein C2I36_13610 [Rhodobacteraceae bacterium WD3A24]|nr:hypothetical protein C2I36_13610 [Rhodobacteraceae bacterium WD3A24]